MWLFITISLFLISLISVAQTKQETLITIMKDFHQALVKKNTSLINQQTDEALSYGHSNGLAFALYTRKDKLIVTGILTSFE